MSSPPGFSTRMKSSSVASGSGTAVMTYCATTASKNVFGEGEILRVHHRERLDIGKPQRPHALLRLAQHRLGNIDAAQFRGARIIRQRQVRCRRRHRECGRRSGRPPRWWTGGRARTPCRTPDRRPAPSAHKPLRPPRGRYLQPCPRPELFIRALPRPAALRSIASLSAAALCAVALWMKPPPSTRACPDGAS